MIKKYVTKIDPNRGSKTLDRRSLDNSDGDELKEFQPVGSSSRVVARRAKTEAGSDLSGRLVGS
jgi:hypothetical protein